MIAAHETPHAYHSRMDSLIVHRASRTERLADELIEQLDAHRPDNPLAPQTVIVPHAGMRRWLLQTIARRCERVRGIAANVALHRLKLDKNISGGLSIASTSFWYAAWSDGAISCALKSS